MLYSHSSAVYMLQNQSIFMLPRELLCMSHNRTSVCPPELIEEKAGIRADKRNGDTYWEEVDFDPPTKVIPKRITAYLGTTVLEEFQVNGKKEYFDVYELALLFSYYNVRSCEELVGKTIPMIENGSDSYLMFAIQKVGSQYRFVKTPENNIPL